MDDDISKDEMCECPSDEIIIDSISRIINKVVKNFSYGLPHSVGFKCWMDEQPKMAYIRKFSKYFYCIFPRQDGEYGFFYFEWVPSRKYALNFRKISGELYQSLNLFLTHSSSQSRDLGETIQQKLNYISHNGAAKIFEVSVEYDNKCYVLLNTNGRLTKGCR